MKKNHQLTNISCLVKIFFKIIIHLFSRSNFNFTPSPSSDSHCESPTSNYNLGVPQQLTAKNGGLSPVIKDEYRIPNNNNVGKSLNFSDEQVDCICDSLQQRGDVKKLENFLALHDNDKPKSALGKFRNSVKDTYAYYFQENKFLTIYLKEKVLKLL